MVISVHQNISRLNGRYVERSHWPQAKTILLDRSRMWYHSGQVRCGTFEIAARMYQNHTGREIHQNHTEKYR